MILKVIHIIAYQELYSLRIDEFIFVIISK